MASWLDYLNQEQQRLASPRAQRSSRTPSLRVMSGGGGGYDPFEVGRSFNIPAAHPAPKVKDVYVPAGPPERFDFSLPYSTPGSERFGVNLPWSTQGSETLAQPPKSTQGDILGSIGDAVGGTLSNINLANAIPYFMERVHVAASEFAKSNADNPLGVVGTGVDLGTGAFLDAIQAASDVVSPILDAFPNAVKNSQVTDRALLYQAMVAGTDGPDYGLLGPVSGPLETLGQLAAAPTSSIGGVIQSFAAKNLPGSQIEEVGQALASGGATGWLTGNTVTGQANQYRFYHAILSSSLSADARLNAQQKLAILRESVDLPESIKAAIRANPNATRDQIDKLIDDDPVGRQWSYDPSLRGTLVNLANLAIFYGAEAKAGTGVFGGVKAVGVAAGAEGAGAAGQVVGRTVGAATGAVSKAARLQAAFTGAGLGLAGVTTTYDAIARYGGDQAASDWIQRLNEPTSFSESPNVQLFTGFMVNPVESIKLLRRGVVKGGDGITSVIGRASGRKLATVYDDETVLYGVLARMYRMPDWQAAKAFAHGTDNPNGVQYYATKEEAYSQVLGSAAEYVLDKLPKQERVSLNARFTGDQEGLQRAVLTTYSSQIVDAVRNHADEVAQRFYSKAWQYHNYNAAFDPNVAAMNALDMRRAMVRNREYLDRNNAVTGYNDFLAPEGASLARQFADQWVDEAGALPRGGAHSLDDLIRMFPSLRTHWQGHIDPKSPTISRAAVEDMIQRAESDYAAEARRNPVRVETGADPVLRHDSVSLDHDYARALGTDVETMQAIGSFNFNRPDPAALDRLRKLLVDKTGADPATLAAASPEEVWLKASDYVEDTTAPWRAAGDRVIAAEKQLTALRSELTRLHALADPSARSAEQVARLADLDREIPTLEATRKALDKANRRSPSTETLQQAAALKERITALTQERAGLRRVSAGHRTMQHAEAIARVEKEIEKLQQITREASDPIRPFSENVRLERSRARQAERVRAMDESSLTPADVAFLRRYVESDPMTQVARDAAPGDLLEMARDMADSAIPLARRDAVLAERAARKVAAQQTLDDLSLIDDTAVALGAEEGWFTRLRKVQGNWTWKGSAPPMSDGLRRAISRWANSAARHALAKEIMHMGDQDAWAVLNDNPAILDTLTRTQRNAVARARSHGAGVLTLDEHAEAAVRAGRVSSSDEFLERLADLADRREQLIESGLAESNLRRTAAMEVPPDYLEEAVQNASSMEWAMMYDAEFMAIVHPTNIAEVQKILDAPAELFPALRRIVEQDPVLDAAVRKIAAEERIPYEQLVRDQTYAPLLRKIIPEGFEPPTPGVRAETELDNLLLTDDTAAIAQRSQQLMEAASQPREPIRTTVSAARRARSAHPSTEWRGRFSEYGADLTAPVSDEILSAPANRVGADVLSMLNSGAPGRPPRTVRGTLALLREIEHGAGVQMGLGASVQAEAQRVANDLLAAALKDAKRSGFQPGVFGGGLDAAAHLADDLELADALQMRDAREALDRTLQRNVRDSISEPGSEAIRTGMEAESQAANRAVGVLRGGTPESGGAVRGGVRDALDRSYSPHDVRRAMASNTDIVYDSTDPLGTLQYGFKRRPTDAVVMELSRVPGLAEEFATQHFQPWAERVGTAHVRQAYNYVFGPLHNSAVAGAVRQRFMDRAAAAGIDTTVSEAIWKRWHEESVNSRDVEIRVNPRTKVREHMEGDNPLYASVNNIPNRRMDKWAHEEVERLAHGQQPLDPAYVQHARTIDYSALFREASSFTRRTLADLPGETLGKSLARAYGMVAHNHAVTTLYYWFRFGLDIRFHAMNYFEAQLLYLGRAGLRRGEIDTGLMGNNEGFLRNLDVDVVNNTGYAQSRSRFAYAYKTFLKEQASALRGKIRGLQAEDPNLMRQALEEIATADPHLRRMIAEAGDTADGWMRAMDEWHGKMLDTATETEAGVVIDEALAKVMGDTPAMAEVYGRLAQVNKDLWGDVRSTFYGNAQRSRAERFLNSYLLFWPLSYQVKATKWMLRVMYDRAGGLPTNAAGAVMLDRLAATHQQLLANDPEYADWYERHPQLVFVAQMLLPITPSSMGVSLNPILRDLFFGRSKAIGEIGPVYTITKVIPGVTREVAADLYPALKDVPVVSDAFRAGYGMATGRDMPDYLRD